VVTRRSLLGIADPVAVDGDEDWIRLRDRRLVQAYGDLTAGAE